ncbi:MAG: diadenylate cyclase CdaA [Candidatus Omnitrophica bacterium]|nr:diadenylate cyclase CdaA [Candidatus Omnitrophota bacterium]
MVEFLANIWRPVVEILFMWLVLYGLLVFIKGTRAVPVVRGLILLIVLFILSQKLGLHAINWVLTKLFAFSAVAFLVIFQPELRRGLAHIGQNRFFGFFLREKEVIDQIVKAILYLSNRKIGALIAIEREVRFTAYVETGIPLDSKVSMELITTVFMPNTPLHDGAMVIKGQRIIACGCLFPLTQNPKVSKILGTRHRAGIGLTEETDAVCILVSEETGAIAMSIRGKLTRDLDEIVLRKILKNIYRPKSQGINVAK